MFSGNAYREFSWRPESKSVVFSERADGLYLRNKSGKSLYLIGPKAELGVQYGVTFRGKVISGDAALLCQCRYDPNKQNTVVSLAEMTINATGVFPNFEEYLNHDNFFAIRILPETELLLTELQIMPVLSPSYEDEFVTKSSNSDILVATPDYPTHENKYLCAFVHSRLKAYRQRGLDFDVVCCKPYRPVFNYEYEGINITRLSFYDLRTKLRDHNYKKIVIHFFTEQFARVLDSCDTRDADIYIWAHGIDVLYWDTPEVSSKYFKEKDRLTEAQKESFGLRDKLIKRYNANPKVHWVFVSEFVRERAEGTIGIKFNNAHVIPNFIDEECFRFQAKDPELRKKIFFVRKYDALASYSTDVAVRCIIELSRRDFFDDLEFNIYGTGPYHSKLFDPIKDFSNVHLNKRYLTHSEIAEAHSKNGIALFPTRFDTQGVSMCEAAASGLAVVSTKREAVYAFLPKESGLFADAEDYIGFADIIENLYRDPDHFVKAAKMSHDWVSSKCGYEQTISKELDLLQTPWVATRVIRRVQVEPLLSVAIPSYNMAAYLPGCIRSLMCQAHSDRLDVIIVNDGSKDDTVKVAKRLMSLYNNLEAPIIRLVDKENGGHGSAVNAGIDVAKGRYFRVIDADDWVDSGQFEKMIEILEREESDIVLCDYTEDLALPSKGMEHKLYQSMAPGQSYVFDDMCYKHYGFAKWGPIMHTGSFKTKMLQENGFKLSEHCFYVDMQFDMYSIVDAQTVVYYPLNVYQYFVGREGQSVSKASFVKNRFNHQKVIFSMLDYVRLNTELSALKKAYVINNLIYPLLGTQNLILTVWHPERSEFLDFDRRLSAYPEVYKIVNKWGLTQQDRDEFAFHRRTRGLFLNFPKLTKKLCRMYRKYVNPR